MIREEFSEEIHLDRNLQEGRGRASSPWMTPRSDSESKAWQAHLRHSKKDPWLGAGG